MSWWSEFGQTFATEKDWTNIIWNNCQIRIDNKPVHYKNYYEAGIVFTQDLLFNLNVADAYNHLSNTISKTNILQLAGLRRSIPLAILAILTNSAILAMFCQFCQISSSIGIHTTRVNIGDFGDFDKSAILAMFCQFRQISSSIGIHTTRVNIGEFGDFGDFDKFGNFGDVLPISSN